MTGARERTAWWTAWGVVVAMAGSVTAQQPWTVFIDSESDSECGIVNAGNAELAVLLATSELIIVSGADAVLEGSFVNAEGDVFLDDEPVGFISFADDGDGFRTLWWLTLTGTVVDIDTFTGEPSDSGLRPDEIAGAFCDTCELWDDQSVCEGDPDGRDGRDGFPVFSLCGAGVGPGMLVMSCVGLAAFRLRRGATPRQRRSCLTPSTRRT